ncbi:MAG: tetratricopeptide repeat protein, partial [Anaerolineae bacterium]|nr:tetratricopeptide repeat protein [Anaerolineae bacterium]
MPSLLLTTKLSPPAAPHSLVRRARLLDRLNEGCRRKLTLVSAPAGFGKTTLLAEWAAAARLLVAWVSLDEHDNDPHRFWTYVIAALAGPSPVAEAPLLLQPGPSRALDDALAGWINEAVHAVPGDLALVLDDFHLITNPALHRSVTFLLDHSPPRLHLVIAGREALSLPVARLRAQGQLMEVRAGDLSFTPAETAALLRRILGLDLSADVLEALQARTEGWAAALQLAALSLREGTDPAEFIRTFAGTHRHIVDYLAEQVLQRQEPRPQRFLTETSILERLSGPLCDALLGEAGSQDTLERLERANLFLVPLDNDRRWYRYHQLFAGFMQARLRQDAPGRWRELHCRAARWLEQQGDAPQAFEHWITAGEVDQAARLAEESGRALLERAEAALVLAWLERLPRQAVRCRPWLSVLQAYALAIAGQVSQAETCLQEAEQAVGDTQAAGAALPGEIWGHIAAIRAYYAMLASEPERAHALIRTALVRLPPDARSSRSGAHNLLGSILLALDDAEGARQAFHEAVSEGRQSESPSTAVAPLLNLADLQRQQGRLRQAFETMQEAVRLGQGPGGHALPISADAYAGVAGLLYEWNELEAAAEQAEMAVALSRRGGDADAIVRCCLTLAWTCRAQGRLERARGLLQGVEQMVRRGRATGQPQLGWGAEQMWLGHRLRWSLAEGEYRQAARLAEEHGLGPEEQLTFRAEPGQVLLARLLLAQGRAEEALQRLERLLDVVIAAGRMGRATEVLALLALALQARGEGARAVEALLRALALA